MMFVAIRGQQFMLAQRAYQTASHRRRRFGAQRLKKWCVQVYSRILAQFGAIQRQ
jgi:hypothetical protein